MLGNHLTSNSTKAFRFHSQIGSDVLQRNVLNKLSLFCNEFFVSLFSTERCQVICSYGGGRKRMFKNHQTKLFKIFTFVNELLQIGI